MKESEFNAVLDLIRDGGYAVAAVNAMPLVTPSRADKRPHPDVMGPSAPSPADGGR